MPVMAISKFERFFRLAASLDIDKSDIKRYSDFVQQKIYDLLLMGVATAKANDRDIVEPWDLPITKGLQENIHAFRGLDAETASRTSSSGLPHGRRWSWRCRTTPRWPCLKSREASACASPRRSPSSTPT
jgi:hypothetical protein